MAMQEPPEFDSTFPPASGKFHRQQVDASLSLREFAQRVSYVSNLETGGKMPPREAYRKIKTLYKQLKKSHQ